MLVNIKHLLSRFMLMALFLFSVSLAAFAQNKTITGKIMDSNDGSPLVGATVTAKGTGKAVVTDATGRYSIELPTSVTQLTISYTGFTTMEVSVTGNNVDVRLVSTSASLSDVVVIGYGTTRKKDLTGSVATIGTKDFVKGALTSPEQLITGKVAGVQITSNSGAPGSGSRIRIRGGSSLNASNDPLIVIDGMPLDNGGISGQANALALINPNDIETFTILKDASATAIYGSRASNGVIMITTKKGAKGKPTVNFSSLFSVGKIVEKVDVLTSKEVRDIVYKYGNAAFRSVISDVHIQNGVEGTDWQDQIYQSALSTDN
ncbi:MAG: TonB-dependent receptor plug domain-containing protein, partial [Chitinophagaceae bacterium]|nr:TonB-dependent receptor plug domain-containing protein [Chitinophagaceae bacterium]